MRAPSGGRVSFWRRGFSLVPPLSPRQSQIRLGAVGKYCLKTSAKAVQLPSPGPGQEMRWPRACQQLLVLSSCWAAHVVGIQAGMSLNCYIITHTYIYIYIYRKQETERFQLKLETG